MGELKSHKQMVTMVPATQSFGRTLPSKSCSHVHMCAAYMNCGASVNTRVISFVQEIITINLHYLIMSQIEWEQEVRKAS